ncbi:MAG TPA: MotA/TolQ/ExbB proton channel family protein [Bacteroidia bacterium]|nr:MotA/TolQ/ExbB proton channel family protein [Bacteroidia bacterium]HRG51592.1 MotA/TolQ/ExbB proton channel family protein [Bacteroidia bacterium]
MFNSILLQIVTNGTTAAAQIVDSAGNVAQAPIVMTPKQDTLSLLELIIKGGYIMIPMGILSVLTVFYFFERFITIRKASKIDANFMHNIKDYIHNGNMDAAKALCRNTPAPAAKMVEKGVSRIGKPIKEIEEAMENVGALEISKLEKNISVLSLIGRIAPIFGFIGTIAGVIKIFYNISLADNLSIGAISGGLYEKMITSASGLVIGLIAFIAYFIVNAMLDKTIHKMQETSLQFIDLLNEPSKR